MDDPDTAVFFDIGDTLASVTVSPDGRIHLTAYPYVPGVLAELRDRPARLGIISDRGPFPEDEVNRALDDAGLRQFFEPELVIYGRKDSPRIFEQAAASAGAARSVFVGENPAERAHAVTAGFLVAPHPLLAVPVLEEQGALRYVRITLPSAHGIDDWREALRGLTVLPLHVTGPAAAPGSALYAIVTTSVAARLDDLGLQVDRLGAEHEPLVTELYLLRDDRQVRSGFLDPDGNSADFFGRGASARRVLGSTGGGVLVALPAGSSVDDHHFRDTRHGHNLKLVPAPNLLDVLAARTLPTGSADAATPAVGAAAGRILDDGVRPEHLAVHVERYSGVRTVGPDGVTITSRHIAHPGNRLAVATLLADLQQIADGRLTVRRHRFSHRGVRLENVEAELGGTGVDGVVLVTAHLDSTAASDPRYRPERDPAPGADDDASGIAAVLVAAATVAELAAALDTPRRAVRFVLFNAEEHGRAGSKAYARDQAAAGVPIVAVLQLDMIGYDVRAGRDWELHAGFSPSPAVEEASLALATTVADLVPEVSPALPVPEIHPAPGGFDEAEERSDHHSFQANGYAACLACENAFAGPGPDAPPEEMNPHYHSPADRTVNVAYAADIARAVVAASWVVATR